MPEMQVAAGSLVLYKGHPALVKHAGSKVEIVVEAARTVKVRPKDVLLLHPGPTDSLESLGTVRGEARAAWELLQGVITDLPELAELVHGDYTPATAWATWQLVDEGLLFEGPIEAIVAVPPQEVARRQADRAARAAEAQAWQAFLERVQARTVVPEDDRYLREVEALALAAEGRSRVLRSLGRSETPESAHELLLHVGRWDPTTNPHPRRLELPLAAPEIALPELSEEPRLDLTHLPAFAIDDEGSQDPDDALSLDPGSGRLWVHVADVAALVPPDSPTDLEARNRGATLYLPEGKVPMLPSGATDRLGLGLVETSPALSFGLLVDSQGRVADVEVKPTWVKVTRLTYAQAEDMLAEPPLKDLDDLARVYARRRHRNGAVFIDLPEVKVRVQGGRVELLPLPSLRSRELVAEAMLMAGEGAARFALHHGIALPFTTQDPPQELPEMEGMAGMFALRRALRRSQQSSLPGPHGGLGLEVYARVTSPLRRYLDLVVHQQMRALLRGQSMLGTQEILERIGAAEAASGSVRLAEQQARAHWTLVYLLQHQDWQGEGVLLDKAGLLATVLIPELGLETRVHLRQDMALNSLVPLTLAGTDLPRLQAHFRV